MKKHLFILSSLCLVLSACANDNRTNTPPDADNTGRNVRDRNDQALTSGNQSESEGDRTITQKIRQAIVDDDSLSTNAKNVKIITVNGVVTLRGPVNNDRERNEIANKARAVSGVKNVDNQLEIVRNGQTGGR
jgi:hyperosmotically inducible periplasmic protein